MLRSISKNYISLTYVLHHKTNGVILAKLLTFKVDFSYKKEGSAWDLGKFHQGKSINLTTLGGHQHSQFVQEKSN